MKYTLILLSLYFTSCQEQQKENDNPSHSELVNDSLDGSYFFAMGQQEYNNNQQTQCIQLIYDVDKGPEGEMAELFKSGKCQENIDAKKQKLACHLQGNGKRPPSITYTYTLSEPKDDFIQHFKKQCESKNGQLEIINTSFTKVEEEKIHIQLKKEWNLEEIEYEVKTQRNRENENHIRENLYYKVSYLMGEPSGRLWLSTDFLFETLFYSDDEGKTWNVPKLSEEKGTEGDLINSSLTGIVTSKGKTLLGRNASVSYIKPDEEDSSIPKLHNKWLLNLNSDTLELRWLTSLMELSPGHLIASTNGSLHSSFSSTDGVAIIQSTDEGQTWSILSHLGRDASLINSILKIDESMLLAFGLVYKGIKPDESDRGGKVWISEDNGQSWQIKKNLNGNSRAFISGVTNGKATIVSVASDSSLLRIENKDIKTGTWEPVQDLKSCEQTFVYKSVFFANCRDSKSRVQYSEDDGKTWKSIPAPSENDVIQIIGFHNDIMYIVERDSGNLYKVNLGKQEETL